MRKHFKQIEGERHQREKKKLPKTTILNNILAANIYGEGLLVQIKEEVF